ncbi:unnamed protein product [Tuber aestivum]|uniref:YjeF N-terminal domain-containing protein n=1 Tax=Tuber aestivum TaxID=59557 RepID=A0A292PTF0_9PEZI|nr:unnamed protein product [Tuber aestivum]
MTSQFIGLQVLLSLNDPARTRVRGLVADVNGPELTLRDVLFVDTGYKTPSYKINGLDIEDIDIIPPETNDSNPPPLPTVQPPPPPTQVQAYPQPLSQLPSNQFSRPVTAVHLPQIPATSGRFIDPAIISISRKPEANTAPTTQAPVPNVKHKPKKPSYFTPPRMATAGSSVTSTAAAIRPLNPPAFKHDSSSQGVSLVPINIPTAPTSSGPHSLSASAAPDPSGPTGLGHSLPARGPVSASVLQVPFGDLSLRGDVAPESSAFDETDDTASNAAMLPTPYARPPFSGRRSRRGKVQTRNNEQRPLLAPITQEEFTQKNTVPRGVLGDPITQTTNSGVGLLQPGAMNSDKRRRQRRRERRNDGNPNAEEEGWATEDVNDYKAREFDIQGNLDLFDKEGLFNQMKAEDTTADEARLVSFNRLPQRGSNSKASGVPRKNYHHHENVLGTYAKGLPLNDRDGWPNEFITEESSGDSEDGPGRGRGDGTAAESGRSSRRGMSHRSQSGRRRGTKQMSTSNPSMRSLENLHHHQSSSGGGPGQASAGKSGKPTLRLAPSGKLCPIVSPLQMLDVERIAEVELCLTDDMMTENASRAIAQVAIQAFGKRISASNHNALPVVLVFAGNHKSGARAIAAGRHLKNHHVRVMVCVLGLEREDELLEHVRRQLNIFRNAGGRVARWEELANNLKTLDSPPELIVDGLLGIHLNFDDLRTDQQATAFELVQFANKSKASVLAVDIPSGVDGSTGEVAQPEGTGYLHMRAKWVVCMGAPKSGLLNALVSGIGAGWSLYVADIGISNTAWRKYGTRRRHGVEFAAEWVVELEYHGALSA